LVHGDRVCNELAVIGGHIVAVSELARIGRDPSSNRIKKTPGALEAVNGMTSMLTSRTSSRRTSRREGTPVVLVSWIAERTWTSSCSLFME
jgi:hypothetical protein